MNVVAPNTLAAVLLSSNAGLVTWSKPAKNVTS
jgi:hypothetical protein